MGIVDFFMTMFTNISIVLAPVQIISMTQSLTLVIVTLLQRYYLNIKLTRNKQFSLIIIFLGILISQSSVLYYKNKK